jgi:hypothetical protein
VLRENTFESFECSLVFHNAMYVFQPGVYHSYSFPGSPDCKSTVCSPFLICGCLRMFSACWLFILVVLQCILQIRALPPPGVSASQTLAWFYTYTDIYPGMSEEATANQKYVQLQQTFADMPPSPRRGFILCNTCKGTYSNG